MRLNLQKTEEVKSSGGGATTTIRFGCKEESGPLDQCPVNRGSTEKKNRSPFIGSEHRVTII
jgi:hypothetical protein